ncbi:MAG: repeat protein [Frankiales bacterium]|nr:repeat protein [Frankiales bacterium]
MRRHLTPVAFTPAALLALVIPALVALPVLTGPQPRPHAVAPSVHDLALLPVADVEPVGGVPAVGPAGPVTTLAAVPEQRTAAFSTVGVTWAAGTGGAGLSVHVRTRTEGRWSDWTELDSDGADGPDAASPEAVSAQVRAGTAPLYVGPSDGVQVTVDGPADAQPSDVKVSLIDPGSSAADGSLTATVPVGAATAAAGRPVIISRAQWGADESIRRGTPSYASTVKVGYVHHTDSSNDYTPDEAAQLVRGFYAYHVQSRGWDDIGYNFLVDRFGRIYEGRAGGVDRPVIGAHAGGFNSGTAGVALMGDFTSAAPSAPMLSGLADVLAWKLSLHDRDPLGKQLLTSGGGGTARIAAGGTYLADVISGHRDTNYTSCPGDRTYALLPAVRQAVAARLVPDPAGSITARYAALGGASGPLGAATGPEVAVGAGFAQTFQGGTLFSGPGDVGVHVVLGDILLRYLAAGGPAGPLGFPLADEAGASGGRFSPFERGTVTWTAAAGTRLVYGASAQAYARSGGPAGFLGLPVSEESDVLTGRFTVFQFGRIYWTPATGAHEVHGLILQKYLAMSGPAGPLGFPRVDESGAPGGRFTSFQFGIVTWASRLGAQEIHGDIAGKYLAMGGPAGVLGLALSDELAVPGGRANTFQGGVVTWSPQLGARETHGLIGLKYRDLGGPQAYGLALTDEQPVAGGRAGSFAGGRIFWSPATGAQEVHGLILAKYVSLDGPAGLLGFPIGDEREVPGGRASGFAGGDVFWGAGAGAHVVRGLLRSTYLGTGGAAVHGLPVTDEYPVQGGAESLFERSLLTWSARTGVVTITRR